MNLLFYSEGFDDMVSLVLLEVLLHGSDESGTSWILELLMIPSNKLLLQFDWNVNLLLYYMMNFP